MESSNTVYGRSNNPYHQGRIVGGSSGLRFIFKNF
jgi:Asp-tRNA(Asn)/Glu-tRNA(Gln) amidotransferase A subunit family amidase